MNAPAISIANLRVACSNCSLRELCLPVGLSLEEVEQLDELVATRKRVKRGETPVPGRRPLRVAVRSATRLLQEQA